MIGLTFVKVKEGSSLGYETIKIIDRYPSRKETNVVVEGCEHNSKHTTVQFIDYALDAIADGRYTMLDFDEFHSELIEGYYKLKLD